MIWTVSELVQLRDTRHLHSEDYSGREERKTRIYNILGFNYLVYFTALIQKKQLRSISTGFETLLKFMALAEIWWKSENIYFKRA
jgi:hypothetical protein